MRRAGRMRRGPQITRPDPDVPLPSYAHPGDAGADLVTTVDVAPRAGGAGAGARPAIAIALPDGYVALVHPRSGLAARFGVSIVNAPGHRRRRLPGRDQGAAGQPRPARARRPAPRRPDRPAGRPAGGAGPFVEVDASPVRHAATAGTVPPAVSRSCPTARPRGEALMFRRKKADEPEDEPTTPEETPDRARGAARPLGRLRGHPRRGRPRPIDLGGLLLTPREGLELQLQVDEALRPGHRGDPGGRDGAVELRAFAAPRNGDIWADVRRQVAAEIARMGGTATEHEGPYGTEVRLPDRRPRTASGSSRPPRSSASPARAGCCGPPCSAGRPSSTSRTATWSRRMRDVVVVRGTTAAPARRRAAR